MQWKRIGFFKGTFAFDFKIITLFINAVIGFFKGTFAFDFKIVGFNLDYLGRNRWIFLSV